MSGKGAFISGSTFLIDGGATASYFYGPLKPENLTQKAKPGSNRFRLFLFQSTISTETFCPVRCA